MQGHGGDMVLIGWFKCFTESSKWSDIYVNFIARPFPDDIKELTIHNITILQLERRYGVKKAAIYFNRDGKKLINRLIKYFPLPT